jgi:hypothetical protein
MSGAHNRDLGSRDSTYWEHILPVTQCHDEVSEHVYLRRSPSRTNARRRYRLGDRTSDICAERCGQNSRNRSCGRESPGDTETATEKQQPSFFMDTADGIVKEFLSPEGFAAVLCAGASHIFQTIQQYRSTGRIPPSGQAGPEQAERVHDRHFVCDRIPAISLPVTLRDGSRRRDCFLPAIVMDRPDLICSGICPWPRHPGCRTATPYTNRIQGGERGTESRPAIFRAEFGPTSL